MNFLKSSANYSTLLKSWLLPTADWLIGSRFSFHLQEWQKIVTLDEMALQALQKEKLRCLLSHALTKIPYYCSLNLPRSEDPMVQLRAFPLMDKKTLREQTDQLLASDKSALIKDRSSGSSGVQSTVYQNEDEQSLIRAMQVLWWQWAGYEIGNPLVQTGMTPKRGVIKKLKDLLFRTIYFSAFAYKQEEVERLLRRVQKKPGYYHLAGYASSLYVFSQMAKDIGMNDIVIRSAITWGDKLFAHYRQSIEAVFHCKVYETYGSAEGLRIASQYDLEYLYIMTPHVVLELLDEEGREVPEGEMGLVHVTRLDNFSMPLIRYRIGDLAKKLPRQNYPPERKLALPLLEKVIGRETDLVKNRSGKVMVVHSFTGIFEHIPQVHQFCVIQRDLAGICIEVIAGDAYEDGLLAMVKKRIQEQMGTDFAVEFTLVETIPATASGKPQIIRSLL